MAIRSTSTYFCTTTMSGRTGPLQKGPVAAVVASPPILDFARLVGHFLAASYALVSRTTVTLALSLLAPISLLYSPIAYLLAPVFVLARVLLNVFVLTPYAIITSVARNVYPYLRLRRLCSNMRSHSGQSRSPALGGHTTRPLSAAVCESGDRARAEDTRGREGEEHDQARGPEDAASQTRLDQRGERWMSGELMSWHFLTLPT
ncbi:hypothetical protein C8T65DRAFT_51696 [Cerioporus squamosus]|nr:hypothetical protein C8T65DRAFT_51696 [Cerioporus squamosus]